MKRDTPDEYSFILVNVDGLPAKFWYLIAPPDEDAGYGFDKVSMEDCYVTSMTGQMIEVSEDYIEEFTNTVFHKDEA